MFAFEFDMEGVIGVELDVHDSFGEWWIESAHMHRCESESSASIHSSPLTATRLQEFLGPTPTSSQISMTRPWDNLSHLCSDTLRPGPAESRDKSFGTKNDTQTSSS